jgi:L-rhamnose mutarotase
MPTQATYDDANLILRLYELRREEKLRKAREWFAANFHAASMEDVQRIAPMGSQENAYFRMVVSYWEMAASLVTAGVLNQDLFFQTNGELLFVWERVRDLVSASRAMFKNPNAWRNLETVGNAFIKLMEANGPEAYPAFQAMVRGTGAGH